MSFKKPKRINDRARTFYPNKIQVDKDEKNNPIIISTGPYRKELCGQDGEGIPMYLEHLKERYFDNKMKKVK